MPNLRALLARLYVFLSDRLPPEFHANAEGIKPLTQRPLPDTWRCVYCGAVVTDIAGHFATHNNVPAARFCDPDDEDTQPDDPLQRGNGAPY